MNSLQNVLGKKPEEETPDVATGMGLPTPGDNGEGNPLEKMDQLSKQTKDSKDKGSKDLNSEVLKQMFMTGDNTNGMFSPKEEKEIDGVKVHEEPDEKTKDTIDKGKVEPQGKYKENFKKDFLKHPDEYKIQTPKGEMTVAEAMRKGYDPTTKTFRKEHDADEIKKRNLEGLNDADRASIEGLLNPKAANIAPADAEKYGLKEDSPFVRQPAPEEQPVPPAAPAMETQGVGAPMPGTAQESQAPGAQDLSAILGQGGNV